ncbi:MAG: hypothetical protein ACR2L9_04225 [Solirubrobacteraceae bacterium]
MAIPSLDWSTAEVHDGELIVKIAGDPPDGWKDSFNATAALLGGRDLGSVELEKRSVHVDGVTSGNEERIRHLLESTVQQANAAHQEALDDEEPAQSGGESDDGSADADMADRFRSFASEANPNEANPSEADSN